MRRPRSLSSASATTLQAEPSSIIDATDESGFVKFRMLVYLHDGTLGFKAAFAGPKLGMEQAEPLIDFVLGSLIVAA